MKVFFLSFFLICSLYSFGQLKHKVYVYGLHVKFDMETYSKYPACAARMHQKYGVRYIKKSGAVKEKWKIHNEKAYKKLNKRNGEGWQNKMEQEIIDCVK
ncbi:MAG: hypothetical protein JNL63_07720 [Bacteroidia bacterium]|nr:hypothetical protein [Bacteroidia bacterium]